MTDRAPLPIVLIAAVARNGIIGQSGVMPWRLPGDMAHFRAATMGRPVIMGRRTFESIGRPLPGRPTIVVSGRDDFAPPGVTTASTPEHAVIAAEIIGQDRAADRIMVAGGAAIYRALLPRAQSLLITEVDSDPAGDRTFPAIDQTVWQVAERQEARSHGDDSHRYAFVRFERR